MVQGEVDLDTDRIRVSRVLDIMDAWVKSNVGGYSYTQLEHSMAVEAREMLSIESLQQLVQEGEDLGVGIAGANSLSSSSTMPLRGIEDETDPEDGVSFVSSRRRAILSSQVGAGDAVRQALLNGIR